MRTLTARARFLTTGGTPPNLDVGQPPSDSDVLGPAVPADGLTVTLSAGSSLFDHRYGLGDRIPRKLTLMITFPNDALEPACLHGDLLLQFCANHPDTIHHAIRDITRHTRGGMQLRWKMEGYNSPPRPSGTSRNLLGFKDGTANPTGTLASSLIWVDDPAEPVWAQGGSCQVVRLIRMLVEFWDRVSINEQQNMFGRRRDSRARMRRHHPAPASFGSPAGRSTTPLAVPAGEGGGALSTTHTLTVPADDVHRAKDVTIAADGTVYLNVGSSSNASPDDRAMAPQRAVIMAVSPDGMHLRVVERGVRNGEGLAVAPDGTVWTAVNERDNIPYPSHGPDGTYSDAFGQVIQGYVNNHPPDEVVPVTAGQDLGWPYCDPDQDDNDPAGSLADVPLVRRCQTTSVCGVTSRPIRSGLGSNRARVASTARSAQAGFGRATCRRSTATSCRSTGSPEANHAGRYAHHDV